MKSAIITHTDCPDGAASVIIATKIQASVQAHFADHSQVDALTTKLANAVAVALLLLGAVHDAKYTKASGPTAA